MMKTDGIPVPVGSKVVPTPTVGMFSNVKSLGGNL